MATSRDFMPKCCQRGRRVARLSVLSVLFVASFVIPSFATDRAWTPTGNSSNDFSSSGNWNPSGGPGGGDRAFITNNSASANQTNISWRSGNYQMFGAANVGIIVSNSNTAGSGINKFLSNSGFFEIQGLVVGNNGIVELAN